MVRLVTRADDAGCCRVANEAILDACTHGIARNVSLMACAPEIEHAAHLLAHRRDICFGLHVTLNCEWAVPRWGPVADPAEVPSLLAEDGAVAHAPQELHDRGAPVGEMMVEVRAQITRLRDLGFDVRYMDEHMGIGWVNALGDTLAEFAKTEGLIFRPPLERLPPAKCVAESAPRSRWLVAALQEAPAGTYLIVGHPCYDRGDARELLFPGGAHGEVSRDRDDQRLMFMAPQVIEFVKTRGISLVRYGE
jgi:predicted glycoside hydrolase/deacetylase ChbG (UPF0249 family)